MAIRALSLAAGAAYVTRTTAASPSSEMVEKRRALEQKIVKCAADRLGEHLKKYDACFWELQYGLPEPHECQLKEIGDLFWKELHQCGKEDPEMAQDPAYSKTR